jgi:probable HAF family extracellular repeat protein
MTPRKNEDIKPLSKKGNRLGYTLADLGIVDINNNVVRDINNDGVMVGSVANPATGGIEAFIQQNREKIFLGTLGGFFSVAQGINSQGEVVGLSLTQGNEDQHAFLYFKGVLHDLNSLVQVAGWKLMQALAINDFGQIVGIGSFRGRDRMFLLDPTDD